MNNVSVGDVNKKHRLVRKKVFVLIGILMVLTLVIILGLKQTSPKTTLYVPPKSNSISNVPPVPPSQPSPCKTPAQAAQEIGQVDCIGYTGYAYVLPSGQSCLTQDQATLNGFAACIPPYKTFGRSILKQYSGKAIVVTGAITKSTSGVQIEVNNIQQIQAAQ
jgi:hypothetical protein